MWRIKGDICYSLPILFFNFSAIIFPVLIIEEKRLLLKNLLSEGFQAIAFSVKISSEELKAGELIRIFADSWIEVGVIPQMGNSWMVITGILVGCTGITGFGQGSGGKDCSFINRTRSIAGISIAGGRTMVISVAWGWISSDFRTVIAMVSIKRRIAAIELYLYPNCR